MAEKKIDGNLEHNYLLIGIAATLREYKLCFHLNKILQCDFQKVKSVQIEQANRTAALEFNTYKAKNINNLRMFTCYANKSNKDYLIAELKQFDYLLQIEGTITAEEQNAMLQNLKAIPEVLLCSIVPIKKLKNRDRLIYVEEKHPQKLIAPKRRLI